MPMMAIDLYRDPIIWEIDVTLNAMQSNSMFDLIKNAEKLSVSA
jgi:hypothetical protein